MMTVQLCAGVYGGAPKAEELRNTARTLMKIPALLLVNSFPKISNNEDKVKEKHR